VRNLDAQRFQLLARLLLQVLGIHGEDVRRPFKNQHLRLLGIDVAEVVAHIEPRDVRDRPGKFHRRSGRRRR
jgi:hypothetical protein